MESQSPLFSFKTSEIAVLRFLHRNYAKLIAATFLFFSARYRRSPTTVNHVARSRQGTTKPLGKIFCDIRMVESRDPRKIWNWSSIEEKKRRRVGEKKNPVSRKGTFRNSGSLLLVYVHVDIAVLLKWDDDSRVSRVTTAETSKTSSSSRPSPRPGDDAKFALGTRRTRRPRNGTIGGGEGRRRRRRQRFVSNFVTGVVGWNAREGALARSVVIGIYVLTYVRTYAEHRGNGRRRYSVVKRRESARARYALVAMRAIRVCARARASGETGLERIPFIDVGTRRTRKRKGRRCGTVKERGGGRWRDKWVGRRRWGRVGEEAKVFGLGAGAR